MMCVYVRGRGEEGGRAGGGHGENRRREEKKGEQGRRKESVSWKDVETGRGGGDVVKSD